jgi:hypothetical protein
MFFQPRRPPPCAIGTYPDEKSYAVGFVSSLRPAAAESSSSAMSIETGRLERLAPLTGFIAVALWILGVFLLEKDDRPDGKDTAAFVAWVEENDTSILAGAIIFGFGVLFFLWLLGSLRTALITAESGTGRLSSITFASGVAVSISLMFTYLPHAQAAFDHENTSDTAIEALVRVGDAFFGGAVLFSIPMLTATALAVIRFGGLPRWLAWFSLVIALIMAIPTLGFFGVVVGLPVWTLLVSVLLYRRVVPDSSLQVSGDQPS